MEKEISETTARARKRNYRICGKVLALPNWDTGAYARKCGQFAAANLKDLFQSVHSKSSDSNLCQVRTASLYLRSIKYVGISKGTLSFNVCIALDTVV